MPVSIYNTSRLFSSARIVFTLVALFVFGSALRVEAANAKEFIHERPHLQVAGKILTLMFQLSVDNEKALGDTLRDGSTLELTLEIDIERKRSLWFNASIAKPVFVFQIRHDQLSRNFVMSLPDGSIMQNKSLRALLSQSWKDLELPLLSMQEVEPGETYLFELSMSLRHTELPPWLDRTLVLWDRDVVAKKSIKFEYRLEDGSK